MTMMLSKNDAPSQGTATLSTVADKILRGEKVDRCDMEDLRRQSLQKRHDIDDEGAKNPNVASFLDRPFLQTHEAHSKSVTIVRYIGMVQDMLDPEFYVGEVNGFHTKYRDYCGDSDDDKELEDRLWAGGDNLMERSPLVVVPVPFISPWLLRGESRYECEKEGSFDVGGEVELTARGTKRSLEVDGDETLTLARNCNPPNWRENKSEAIPPTPNDWWPEGCMGSDPLRCPVIAKFSYDENDERLRLNDIVEIVGVLHLDPMDANFDPPDDLFAVVPPPSQMPRIHVLYHSIIDLTPHHIPRNPPSRDDYSLTVRTFAEYLFLNDTVPAKALLLSLLSTPDRMPSPNTHQHATHLARNESPTHPPLGCLSLNLITDDPAPASHRMHQILSQVCPVVVPLDLSSQTLNSSRYSPPRQREDGRLDPSQLQLPHSSTLILSVRDDLSRIDPTAASTFDALSLIVEQQKCPYHFGCYAKTIDTDYRVVTLSTSREFPLARSCTFAVPCRVKGEALIPPDVAKRIETFLNQSRQAPRIDLSEEICQEITGEFIRRRANSEGGGIGEEDLHRWLILTRVMCRANKGYTSVEGEGLTVDMEDWKAVLTLEDQLRAHDSK